MKQNFDEEKINLVKYFKQEKYKTFNHGLKAQVNNNVYLYNIENKPFQIIRIIDNFKAENKDFNVKDSVIEKIEANFSKKYQRAKLNVLNIIFNNEQSYQQVDEKEAITTIFLTSDNWVRMLETHFPSIAKHFNFNQSEQEEHDEFSGEEQVISVDSPQGKKIMQLKTKMQVGNLFVTWIFIVTFMISSIVLTFFSGRILNIDQSITDDDTRFVNLVFGALDRDLLLGSNQWWRIFTYPLNITSNPFVMVLLGFIFFFYSRFVEATSGKIKLFLILVIGYPLTGLLSSLINMHQQEINGWLSFDVLLIGYILVCDAGKEKDIAVNYVRPFLVFPLFMILIYPTMSNSFHLYPLIFISFFIGTAFGFIFDINSKSKFVLSLVYPLLIFAAIISGIVALIILFHLSDQIPAWNKTSVLVLDKYRENRLVSTLTLNDYVKYFFPWKNNIEIQELLVSLRG